MLFWNDQYSRISEICWNVEEFSQYKIKVWNLINREQTNHFEFKTCLIKNSLSESRMSLTLVLRNTS